MAPISGKDLILGQEIVFIKKGSCKSGLSCHPERSEGSQAFKNTRFLAALRMTSSHGSEFC
jgi:hypothetical protein